MPLDLLRQRLPRQPYCGTSIQLEGIRRQHKRQALSERHIQLNHPSLRHCITFDVDHMGAALRWDATDAPPPSLSIQNPATGHAHLVYVLEAPVSTTAASRSAPIAYLASIEQKIGRQLGADPSYSGFLTRNPWHSNHRIQVWEPLPYTLDHLADWHLRNAQKAPRSDDTFALGRNHQVFTEARTWAYRAIQRHGFPEWQEWHRIVRAKVETLSAALTHRLPAQEERSIAKSVARWTHTRFTEQAFSRIQAARGAKGGKASGVARRKGSIEEEQPWLALGISRRTWYRRKR